MKETKKKEKQHKGSRVSIPKKTKDFMGITARKKKNKKRKKSLKVEDTHKKEEVINTKEFFRKRNDSKKEVIISKGGECEVCGFKYDGENAACFEFHHINPSEKKYNPSTALRLIKEERDKELSKCLLVCANCHRLIHAERKLKK